MTAQHPMPSPSRPLGRIGGSFKNLPALVQVTIKQSGVQLADDWEIERFASNLTRSIRG